MPVKRFTLIKDLLHWMDCDHTLLLHQVEDVLTQTELINRLAADLK